MTAVQFIERLHALSSAEEAEKILRYFKSGEGQYGAGDQFIGVRMGQVFELAKEFIEMTPAEIERLLESDIHEARAGGMSIMDRQGRHKKTPDSRRKELFDLYIRRSDRINNWDLVDLAAQYVVGRYLIDQPRDILYELAVSDNIWERRSAIVSTSYFLKKGETKDTFKIAEILLHDDQDLIHKAAGGWIRQAGKTNKSQLLGFLDHYAAIMPRVMLRYAIEHLNEAERAHYLGLKGH